jgi:hypothetical protein
VVVYLRRVYYPGNPASLFPMRLWEPTDLLVELAREAATLVMILAVAVLAVTGRVRRIAAFVFVFGVWDLFYYLWLKVALDWPRAWGEWDILFLITWAWLAPWMAPALIALLVAGWGAAILLRAVEPAVPRRAWALAVTGLLLALASFLAPALPLLGAGPEAVGRFVPERFLWALYVPGVTLLAAGLVAGRAGPGAQPPPARPPLTSR